MKRQKAKAPYCPYCHRQQWGAAKGCDICTGVRASRDGWIKSEGKRVRRVA